MVRSIYGALMVMENAQKFFEHFGWRNIATERFVEIADKEYKYLLYQKNYHD